VIDASHRAAKFLAVVVESAEFRQQLAEVQDQCVELAVDAGELLKEAARGALTSSGIAHGSKGSA
jgi:hypothetical protein